MYSLDTKSLEPTLIEIHHELKLMKSELHLQHNDPEAHTHLQQMYSTRIQIQGIYSEIALILSENSQHLVRAILKICH